MGESQSGYRVSLTMSARRETATTKTWFWDLLTEIEKLDGSLAESGRIVDITHMSPDINSSWEDLALSYQ